MGGIKQNNRSAALRASFFFTVRFGGPTNQFRSGTVEEIERHIRAGKPAMLYFSKKVIRPGDLNHEQYGQVEKLKAEFQGKSYYETFDTTQDFEKKFTMTRPKKT